MLLISDKWKHGKSGIEISVDTTVMAFCTGNCLVAILL